MKFGSSEHTNNEQPKISERESEVTMETEKTKKLALICATQVDLGIRTLSGAVQEETGKAGQKIEVDMYNLLVNEHRSGYSEKVLEQLYAHLDDKDFIGISTIGYNFVEKIVPLVENLREHYGHTKPIIMGGDQAIQNTEQCWATGVDAVCFGEGEIDFPNLLQNWEKRFDPEVRKTIKNFVLDDSDLTKLEAMRTKLGELKAQFIAEKKPTRDLAEHLPEEYKTFARKLLRQQELDKLTPDMGFKNFYSVIDGELQPATPEKMPSIIQHQAPQDQNVLVYAFQRGCPFACEYCYYSNIEKITGEKTERHKSIAKAIEEMKMGKDEIEKERRQIVADGGDPGPEPFLLMMNADTSFLSDEELQEFRDLYKQEIGMPFYCMNHPNSVKKDKMRLLLEAGMVHMNIGVQTNENSNGCNYNRKQTNEKVIQISEWANELRAEGHDLTLLMDFIIYSPFEDRAQIKETVEFVKQIKPPFDYIPHTLFLGPESPLRARYDKESAERAETDNPMGKLLEDCQGDDYSNFHDTYRFYKTLRHNGEFVTNTICEFMAGQINEQKFGRLPRFAKDLKSFDVFDRENLIKVVDKEVKKLHNPEPDPNNDWEALTTNPEAAAKYRTERIAAIDAFLDFFSKKLENVADNELAIDLLMSNDVLAYFDNDKDVFINIALAMKDLHHQKFTNEDPELKKMGYEDEYPDKSKEVNFG
jgi:radical SAM superfamily enzyme YgiQ (UPF0313 family)